MKYFFFLRVLSIVSACATPLSCLYLVLGSDDEHLKPVGQYLAVDSQIWKPDRKRDGLILSKSIYIFLSIKIERAPQLGKEKAKFD